MHPKLLLTLVIAAIAVGVGATAGFYFASTTGEGQPPEPVSPTILRPEDVRARFVSGAPWDGKGNGNQTLEQAAGAPGLTPLWLGTEFAGYNLQAVLHQDYKGPDGRSVNKLIFIYGDCILRTNGERPSCSVPLEVHVESSCAVRPEQVAGTVKSGSGVIRGSAQSVRFTDGHLLIWTGTSAVTIHAPGQPAIVDSAALALRSLRPADAIAPQSPLQQPDFAACE